MRGLNRAGSRSRIPRLPTKLSKGRTVSTVLTRRGVVVLSAVCLSSLMFGLEISSIPSILPTLERVLHADFTQLQWIMNAYTIAVTTVLMAIGTLADRYGRKRLFLLSTTAFGLMSLMCGLAGILNPAVIFALQRTNSHCSI